MGTRFGGRLSTGVGALVRRCPLLSVWQETHTVVSGLGNERHGGCMGRSKEGAEINSGLERDRVLESLRALIPDVPRLYVPPEDSESVGVFRGIPSREVCKMCWHVNPVGFAVPDDVWASVVPASHQDKVICITCFARLGDERAIRWDRSIELFPVSLASHLDLG